MWKMGSKKSTKKKKISPKKENPLIFNLAKFFLYGFIIATVLYLAGLRISINGDTLSISLQTWWN